MIYKRIKLTEDEWAYLDCYVADATEKYTRPAILVIPGGGYHDVCSNREGEPIALAFMAHGYQAFVLHYSVARTRTFPTQLIEASLAMKHIRENAEAYGLDPARVFVTGFSAGGHLAGSLGILWKRPDVVAAVGGEYGINRPNGMMLCYPVISGELSISHRGSFRNLWGTDEPTEEQLMEASLERHVDADSAPLFAMHTANDTVVPVQNSLVLATAYAKAGRKFELHILPNARHGAALGNPITQMGIEEFDNPAIAAWVDSAVFWAERVSEGKA